MGAEEIGGRAPPYVKSLCGSGVMHGEGHGDFLPRGSCTAERSIAAFNRLFPALYEQTAPLCGKRFA